MVMVKVMSTAERFGMHELALRLAGLVAGGLLLLGCSGQKPHQLTEEEIHAHDMGKRTGIPDLHAFACRGGGRLLVDLENQGLTLSVRGAADQPPLTLTAPGQGLAFSGDGATATVVDRELRLVLAHGAQRTCIRQSRG